MLRAVDCIVEEGVQIRPDLTVIMVAPKCPGTEVRSAELEPELEARPSVITVRFTCPGSEASEEGETLVLALALALHLTLTLTPCPPKVREEYKRGFGVPTLIAVHPENDPNGNGLELAKAYAAATGGHRAGVLESSFVAEVKSDLMGEQTILCGMLQTGAVLSFDKMVANGIDAGYASKLIQYG